MFYKAKLIKIILKKDFTEGIICKCLLIEIKKEILGIPVLNIKIGAAKQKVKLKEDLPLKKKHRIRNVNLN